jgi:hypothetical protein
VSERTAGATNDANPSRVADGARSPTGAAAGRLVSRLERIEALDRERAPTAAVLGELRELVREAEAWARLHGEDDPGVAGAEEAGGNFDGRRKE